LILFAIFPSRAAPAHAGTPAFRDYYIFDDWKDFDYEDDAIKMKKKFRAIKERGYTVKVYSKVSDHLSKTFANFKYQAQHSIIV